MNGKSAKDSGDSFVEHQFENDEINDFSMELLCGDDLADNTVNKLIMGLRRKYPGNGAIIELSKALGLEPKQEWTEKDFDPEEYGLETDFVKTGDAGLEENAVSADSGNGENAGNIENGTSVGFYRALDRIIFDLQNIE